jgi:hypothetical protein
VILIDVGGLILKYYRRKASMAGQPGSADAFLYQLTQVAYRGDVVLPVEVGGPPEFGLPNSFLACGFDADDRIYVALARACPPSQVVNAVDSDYEEHAEALGGIGVSVRQLCP